MHDILSKQMEYVVKYNERQKREAEYKNTVRAEGEKAQRRGSNTRKGMRFIRFLRW